VNGDHVVVADGRLGFASEALRRPEISTVFCDWQKSTQLRDLGSGKTCSLCPWSLDYGAASQVSVLAEAAMQLNRRQPRLALGAGTWVDKAARKPLRNPRPDKGHSVPGKFGAATGPRRCSRQLPFRSWVVASLARLLAECKAT
jgi:hypothetical protein